MIDISAFGDTNCPTNLDNGAIYDYSYLNKLNTFMHDNDLLIEKNKFSFSNVELSSFNFEYDNFYRCSANDSGFMVSLPQNPTIDSCCIYYDGKTIDFEHYDHSLSNTNELYNYQNEIYGNYSGNNNKITDWNTKGYHLKESNDEYSDIMKTTAILVEGSIKYFNNDYLKSQNLLCNSWQQVDSYEYMTPYLSLYCNDILVQRFTYTPVNTRSYQEELGGTILNDPDMTISSNVWSNESLPVSFYLESDDLSNIDLKLMIDYYEVPIEDGKITNIEYNPTNISNCSRKLISYSDLKSIVSTSSGRAVGDTSDDTKDFSPIGNIYTYRSRCIFNIKGQYLKVTRFGDLL